jgi:hypothetical protein
LSWYLMISFPFVWLLPVFVSSSSSSTFLLKSMAISSSSVMKQHRRSSYSNRWLFSFVYLFGWFWFVTVFVVLNFFSLLNLCFGFEFFPLVIFLKRIS